jgi:hypothetical protein
MGMIVAVVMGFIGYYSLVALFKITRVTFRRIFK